MTNPRYARKLKDLKGLARKVAEDQMYKRNPPFLRAQMDYTVKEEDIIDTPPFVEGDRVQIIKGEDKGKVGRIHAIYKEGNCAFVEGLGGTTKMVLPRVMWLDGQTKPVTNVPNPIPYDDLRVVSQTKNEDGTVEDVAVHSVTFEGSYYDEDRNKMMPIRRAKHDPSMIIPYPVPPNPVQASREDLATSASVVGERTFFPSTITQGPIVPGALDQIRNPHSKWNREKKSRKISAEEAEFWSAPKMPTNPKTKKLLQQLEKLPKANRTEFTPEIESFINQEVESGLQNRAQQETNALDKYT